jgi:hypothetical protein
MESRRPYPLDDRGLPLVPEGIGDCYDICLRGIKEQNRHHSAWPKAEHRTPPKRGYREAASMIVKACVCKQADLHATYLPPKQPSIHTMYDVIQGDIAPIEAPVFIRSRNEANV